MAKQSLGTHSLQGKTYSASLESLGMIPQWSGAVLKVNSRHKTVLAVPLQRTATTYTELNMIATDGAGHTIFKKYTTVEDGGIKLEFYALDGTLLITGTYNSKTKVFRQHKSFGPKLSLFAPKATSRVGVSPAYIAKSMSAITNGRTYKILSATGGKTTDDPDKDGEDLKEVVIVGTPPYHPSQDPFPIPELPTGPVDYYPTDPATGPGSGGGDGNEAAPTLILSLADRVKYPVLAQIVDKLYQKVKNDPKLMDALKKFSHLSETQILDNLVPGKGPTLVVVDFPPNQYGQYDPKTNTMMIDKTIAGSTNFLNANFSTALDLFLTANVLHEFIHFGESYTQTFWPHAGNMDDIGYKFENQQYGGIMSFNSLTGEITYKKLTIY